MTSYARREIITRRVEYGIAAGAGIGDFEKVKGIAWADWCRRHGHDPEGFPNDGWARVEPRDEETVIVFTVDEEVPS